MGLHFGGQPDGLIVEIGGLVQELGKDGGLISPSIYDTAQVLRLCPPPQGTAAGLKWLMAQQQPDGGWGEPSAAIARQVPTLAALLTLRHWQPSYRGDTMGCRIQAGLRFLRDQASLWDEVEVDALPLAGEMIWPHLVGEARAQGLDVGPQSHRRLSQLRLHKISRLRQASDAHTAAASAHSWEAAFPWMPATTVDPLGGMGHSPAATAAWLNRTAQQPPSLARAWAESYLRRAHSATCPAIPGVVPTVWPIPGFETIYGLYILNAVGLSQHPAIQPLYRRHLASLHSQLLRDGGSGQGATFAADADDTALAIAACADAGLPVPAGALERFRVEDYFCTYGIELNPSVLSNVHVLYAMGKLGVKDERLVRWLLSRRGPDGAWLPDKWHSSWYYINLEAVIALGAVGSIDAVQDVKTQLVARQHNDGGWGLGSQSTLIETVYGILALDAMNRHGLQLSDDDLAAYLRACRFLANASLPGDSVNPTWVGKELYSPRRVDALYLLCALYRSTQTLIEDLLPLRAAPAPSQDPRARQPWTRAA